MKKEFSSSLLQRGWPEVQDSERAERGAVRLIDLSKRFDQAFAVRNLNLQVRPGEFLSLLGPSGCGKTTTLRMLSGFETPDTGEIFISGKSVAGLPPYKRDVNTVFQAYALFPHMSVAENVAYGLMQKHVARGEINRRVGEALEMVRMVSFAKRSPKQLSGGQQQRVALARALVNQPSVLLLDEPLGALDRKLREEMQIELKLLQSQLGITFIFVTHDQEEALSMSDRVAVMNEGEIVQLDAPDTIYEEPNSAFVAGFIGQQNFFTGVAQEQGRVVTNELVKLSSARKHSQIIANKSNVLASVRPETISLQVADNVATHGVSLNRINGELASIAHLGDSVQLIIRVPGRSEIISKYSRSDAPNIRVGSTVSCSWSELDVHVYPTSTNER